MAHRRPLLVGKGNRALEEILYVQGYYNCAKGSWMDNLRQVGVARDSTITLAGGHGV